MTADFDHLEHELSCCGGILDGFFNCKIIFSQHTVASLLDHKLLLQKVRNFKRKSRGLELLILWVTVLTGPGSAFVVTGRTGLSLYNPKKGRNGPEKQFTRKLHNLTVTMYQLVRQTFEIGIKGNFSFKLFAVQHHRWVVERLAYYVRFSATCLSREGRRFHYSR